MGTAGAAGAELDELLDTELDELLLEAGGTELLDTELEELLLDIEVEELLDTELDELLDVVELEERLEVEELLESELGSSSLPLHPASMTDKQVADMKPRTAIR